MVLCGAARRSSGKEGSEMRIDIMKALAVACGGVLAVLGSGACNGYVVVDGARGGGGATSSSGGGGESSNVLAIRLGDVPPVPSGSGEGTTTTGGGGPDPNSL